MSIEQTSARERNWRSIASLPLPRLIARRVLTLVPVLLGVTFLSATLLNLLPGDAAAELLGTGATPATLKSLTLKLHLNQPFLVRYGHWLVGVLHGNFGVSLGGGGSVGSLIAAHLPVSAELDGYAFVIALVFAFPIALLAARRPKGVADRFISVVTMAGLSLAPFILALFLIWLFADTWSLFPAIGWSAISKGIGSNLLYLTLPASSLGIPLACFYARVLRADLVEQVETEEYINTARAKGLGRFAVLRRHALRNSLLGLVTVVGVNVGTLIGGTVLVEAIFSLPGMGQQLLVAIQNRDTPLVEGSVLVFAVVAVAANLVTDILYGVLDPRIRNGRRGV